MPAPPAQIEAEEGVTAIVGAGFTVIVTVAVAGAHEPAAVPVTVYVVVEEGDAFTVVPVVALKPVAGDHE